MPFSWKNTSFLLHRSVTFFGIIGALIMLLCCPCACLLKYTDGNSGRSMKYSRIRKTLLHFDLPLLKGFGFDQIWPCCFTLISLGKVLSSLDKPQTVLFWPNTFGSWSRSAEKGRQGPSVSSRGAGLTSRPNCLSITLALHCSICCLQGPACH